MSARGTPASSNGASRTIAAAPLQPAPTQIIPVERTVLRQPTSPTVGPARRGPSIWLGALLIGVSLVGAGLFVGLRDCDTEPELPVPIPLPSASTSVEPTPIEPTASSPEASPAGAVAIETLDLVYFDARLKRMHSELTSALRGDNQRTARSISLRTVDDQTRINAFATCAGAQGAIIVYTRGLLEIQARLARAEATDRRFATHKVREYLDLLGKEYKAGQKAPEPPPGFFDSSQDTDGAKRVWQERLFDEEVAFVVAHELAHHYLSHVRCDPAAPGTLDVPTLQRILSERVPSFNQPNELAADEQGIVNVLDAGATPAQGKTYSLREDGAVLTLESFRALKDANLVIDFSSTHPPGEARIAAVKERANVWRLSPSIRSPIGLPTVIVQ